MWKLEGIICNLTFIYSYNLKVFEVDAPCFG